MNRYWVKQDLLYDETASADVSCLPGYVEVVKMTDLDELRNKLADVMSRVKELEQEAKRQYEKLTGEISVTTELRRIRRNYEHGS